MMETENNKKKESTDIIQALLLQVNLRSCGIKISLTCNFTFRIYLYKVSNLAKMVTS